VATASSSWRLGRQRGTLGESEQREAKVVGELGGDAWGGARAGENLGWHGTRACGGAIARQRRRQRRKKKGGGALGNDLQNQKFQGPHYKPKFTHCSKALMRKWSK
jgi:hypothetical protein